MFQYQCSLTDDDFIVFNLYTLRNNPSYKRSLLLCRLILPAAFLLILLLNLLSHKEGLPIQAGIYVIVSAIWIFAVKPLFDHITVRNLKSQLKRSRSMYTPEYSVSFQEDYLLEISPQQETKVFYDKLERIAVHMGAVYIYPTSLSAFILPSAVFETEADRERLLAFLSERRNDLQIERGKS